jgi:hypothetical protein
MNATFTPTLLRLHPWLDPEAARRDPALPTCPAGPAGPAGLTGLAGLLDRARLLQRTIRRRLPPRRAPAGRPIAVGTAAEPYRPGKHRALLLAAAGADLASGLIVTAAAPAILDDLDLLVELDRRHAVTVDLAIPAHALDAGLTTVERLAAAGLATRILAPGSETDRPGAEPDLRALFERALLAGAYDVLCLASLAPAPPRPRHGRADDSEASILFRRLRLEYGFPQSLPGRA